MCLTVVLLLAAARSAQGQEVGSDAAAPDKHPVGSVAIVTEGECPTRTSVETQLAPLLRLWSVAEADDPFEAAAATSASVVDQGDAIEVRALSTSRVTEDPERDCAERARVAAVLIAMALEPPLLPYPPAPASTPTPESPEADSEPASTRSSSADPGGWELAGGLAVLATTGIGVESGDGPGWAAGPLLRIAAQQHHWAVILSGGMLTSQTLELDGGRASLRRFPADLSFGPVFDFDAWRFSGALGVALDAFSITGDRVAGTQEQLRLDIGPRTTFALTRTLGDVSLLGLLTASHFPRDYELVLEPRGEVGRTPKWWFGAALGVGVP